MSAVDSATAQDCSQYAYATCPVSSCFANLEAITCDPIDPPKVKSDLKNK